MTLPLKQSTTVTVAIGPFTDRIDGYTAETGLAGTMTVYLSKNGGTFAARNSATAITHDGTLSGMYHVELDTTDTNSLGRLQLAVAETATAGWVWHDYTVYPANEYDSNISGSDALQVHQVEIADAVANKIADHVLRRAFATAAASSDGDTKSFRSLLGAVACLVNKTAISGSTLTIYEADDTTSLGTQTVTTDAAANPITGLDTT